MSKATERTFDELKKQNVLFGNVERFNTFAGPLIFTTINGKRVGKRTGIRIDLFGIIDIIALFPDRRKVCGIQSCGTAFSEHMKKILDNANAPIWLRYADLELWGWRQLGKKGNKIWTLRVHKFTLVDFL